MIDITRTVMRAAHAAPTGIDRVERAYLEWAFGQSRYDLAFVCRLRGGQAVFDRATGEKIFKETAFRPVAGSDYGDSFWRRRWRGYGNQAMAYLRASRWFRGAAAGKAALARLGVDPAASMLLNVSHNNIEPEALGLMREIGFARIVALVHDVIPVDFPEFVVANAARRFDRKLDSLARFADGFIFNSDYTAERTLARLAERGVAPPPSVVAHLGIGDLWSTPYSGPRLSEHPYFIILGTIEPRKNHLLLLNLWRRFADEMDAPPHLHIIGWRGWENENIVDFLDRSNAMGRCVFEHPSDSDARVRGWIAGARAALYPSFVEGFGIPVAEALASGTPVICSDIAALREVGGSTPDYVDPLDGPGWSERVLAYCDDANPARAAQLDRIKKYRPPSWADHFREVETILRRIDATSRQRSDL